jgi:hypothetical protein
MTYATLFMPDGVRALSLLTRAEGGPFVVEYTSPAPSEDVRCAHNAEWMLWSYVYDHAPGVFRRAQDFGWVRPPVAMVRTGERLGLNGPCSTRAEGK